MDGVAGVWVEYKGVDILDSQVEQEDLISLDDSGKEPYPLLLDDTELIPTIDKSG
jgi:hypothetical protein